MYVILTLLIQSTFNILCLFFYFRCYHLSNPYRKSYNMFCSFLRIQILRDLPCSKFTQFLLHSSLIFDSYEVISLNNNIPIYHLSGSNYLSENTNLVKGSLFAHLLPNLYIFVTQFISMMFYWHQHHVLRRS